MNPGDKFVVKPLEDLELHYSWWEAWHSMGTLSISFMSYVNNNPERERLINVYLTDEQKEIMKRLNQFKAPTKHGTYTISPKFVKLVETQRSVYEKFYDGKV
jgi:hypothetical protein